MPRHDLDIVSLVFGVAAGGVGLVYLVHQSTGASGRWVWPVLLIVLGVVGLLASSGRRPDDRSGDRAGQRRDFDQ